MLWRLPYEWRDTTREVAMASPPVRVTTLKTYLKEETGLRVGDATATALQDLLVTLIGKVVVRAQAQAVDEDRSTLLARDIIAGFEGFLVDESPELLSSKALRHAINVMDVAALTELVQLVQADLDRP